MDMNKLTTLLKLNRPTGKIKMVLDTDTYNEIDDQFALIYALKSEDKINLTGIYAAPFYSTPFFPPWKSGEKSTGPKDGMEKSYNEILKLLKLSKNEKMKEKVFKGSHRFMISENDAILSDAANNLISQAMELEKDELLYVASIAAITNIASAILIEPKIIDKIVVIWLGCNSLHWKDNKSFNCIQDPFAARIIFNSGVPVIHAPTFGVTSHLSVSELELKHYLKGKNELCDYLYDISCKWAIDADKNGCWSKILWDIVVIAWIVGDERWVETALVHSHVVNDNMTLSYDNTKHLISEVQYVNRDFILEDLFKKLIK